MAKRAADTERIGNQDDFGTVAAEPEPQNQRATAAQLAARRIAKPKGGRRPTPQARPVGANASPLSHSQSFPAPSWGSSNPTAPAGTQQSSNRLSFGQAPGNFSQLTNPSDNSQMSSQSSSFPPPFGGFGSTNFGQQANAPTSTGFNFSAPSVNNPFASLNQNSTLEAAPNGTSGSVFNTPAKMPSTPEEQAKEQDKLPASQRKTPSHWMTNLPAAFQETDPQSFFVRHAPFKWGEPDQPAKEQPKQGLSQSNSTDTGQPSPQPSASLFEQREQPKRDSDNIFGHLQQPSLSTQNPFGQSAAQQPQSSSVFGKQATSPFQPQPDQRTSNPFAHLTSAQNQNSSNIFNNPTTSPTRDGDSMSTTPDTSPQSNNKQDRYGAFASATAAPKPPLLNGSIPNGPGNNIFSFPSNTSNDQSATFASLEGAQNEPSSSIGVQDREGPPSEISLGSPKKNQDTPSNRNRKMAQPTMGRPLTEEKTPAKSPFAGFNPTPSHTASSTGSFAGNGHPDSFQNSLNTNAETPENGTSQLTGKTDTQLIEHSEGSKAHDSRQPGAPPPPPEDFTEEQKRQLITGWRLKFLDKGLQSYIEYSSYSEEEIESISTFYQLRKQAILDADGGPVEEINSKRAAKRQGGPPSKRARLKPPSATSQQSGQVMSTNSAEKGNATKRKAVEELGKDNGKPSSNGTKRSKPQDQVTYPSLPSSSPSSQTAQMFGNLVGKKTDKGLSTTGDTATKGEAVNGVASADVVSSQPGFDRSSPFFPAPNSGSGNTAKQSSPFSFPPSSATTFPQSKPANHHAPSQPILAETSSPFKGFFPSQSSSGDSVPQTSNLSSATHSMSSVHQPSNTSSVFSNLNGDTAQKSPKKRKANDNDANEDSPKEAAPEESEEQRSKKQRTEKVSKASTDSDKENDDSFQPQSTSEQIGSGASIFSQPSLPPANTSNMFGHLAKSSNDHEADDADADVDDDKAQDKNERPRESRRESKQTPPSAPSGPSNVSLSNPFGSSVINPFAGSSFNTPKVTADAGSSTERSLFDRIEKNDKGQPLKAPVSFKDIDLGQTFLKNGKAGSTSSSDIFRTTTPATGNRDPGTTGANSTSETTAAPPAFNLFGKPSGFSTVPTVNMSGSKGTEDSPTGDHTWKAGTPVKFSGTSGAPSINFTSPSPGKTPLTGLFGIPKASTTSETPGSSIFQQFDPSSTKPAPLTFGISAPPKAPTDSLAPPSETQSESTSRATSPGAGESGNEASDGVHEEESHPELDATEASKAEADEDAIFDVKAKANKLTDSKMFNATTGKNEIARKWVLQGVEQLRILKHRDTKKTRMLMKLKVNGRVILNAGLQKSLNYELASAKTVRVPVPTETKVESWTITFGQEADAKELVRLLEENKSN
ncbi:MAG: hypothetical protein Q9182_003256 [Xanthomendoza sp. 2 TL-2023]